MLRILQRYGWLWLLAALMPAALAFSPTGQPDFVQGTSGSGGNNNGDTYQTPNLGYHFGLTATCANGFYIGAPKNLGEEYRRNISTMYYACDASFLDYFGTNGQASIDAAFVILSNGLSTAPLTSWSSNLTEFPQQATIQNYQAEALEMLDLKSTALNLVVEYNLGLADPHSWVWCLRNRYLIGNNACPNYTYQVIQRNFDPATWNPTPYINGTLFTYSIDEFCPTCDAADTVPTPVDPFAVQFSAVATGLQTFGWLYTSLTRDDMGGFRYIMGANTLNVEDPSPDSQLIAGGFTNTATIELLTTADLAAFANQVQTNSPAALQAAYPSLEITTSSSVLTNVTVTNVVINFTNLANSSLTTTNFSGNQLLITSNLAFLAQEAATNDPTTLSNLFPGIIINNTITNFVLVVTTNVGGFFTNYPWTPVGSAPVFVPQITLTTNVGSLYTESFLNVITNTFYTNSFVTTVTTNISGGPEWSTTGQTVTNVTSTTTLVRGLTSGDYYLVPTNLCGYDILKTLLTTVIPSTNEVFQVITNNLLSAQGIVTYFTNHTYVVDPVTCLGFVTNLVSTSTTNFVFTFNNVVTNIISTNTLVTILTTNQVTGAVSTNTLLTNLLSGSIFIFPTNECGLSIIGIQATNITAFTNPPVITFSNGVQLSQSVIVYATNYTARVNPVDCSAPGFGTSTTALREGVNQMQFVRTDFDSLLGQFFAPLTNVYTLTAVQGNQQVVQTFRRIVTRPDILFSANDLNGGGASFQNPDTLITPDSSWDTAHAIVGLAGPGTITNQYQIVFNKVGPVLINQGSDFIVQANASSNFVWGSYDASTNAPIVYPSGTSIMQLEAEVFMQITNSSSLPNGTEGVPYNAVQLGGTGGTPPYIWSIASGSGGLPPGFNFTVSSGAAGQPPAGTEIIPNGIISGIPATGSAGTYDFTIQMTDFGGRSVQQAFILTIQP